MPPPPSAARSRVFGGFPELLREDFELHGHVDDRIELRRQLAVVLAAIVYGDRLLLHADCTIGEQVAQLVAQRVRDFLATSLARSRVLVLLLLATSGVACLLSVSVCSWHCRSWLALQVRCRISIRCR